MLPTIEHLQSLAGNGSVYNLTFRFEIDRLGFEQSQRPDHAAAAAGQLDQWKREPRSCLALVILLDQFPRNIFRNTSRAFATDTAALGVARGAIIEGLDRQLPPRRRALFYLPFEHSEQITDQDESVRLCRELERDHPECAAFLQYAESHREVIRRFGRFPLRNGVLNRVSTPDEIVYIREHSDY